MLKETGFHINLAHSSEYKNWIKILKISNLNQENAVRDRQFEQHLTVDKNLLNFWLDLINTKLKTVHIKILWRLALLKI